MKIYTNYRSTWKYSKFAYLFKSRENDEKFIPLDLFLANIDRAEPLIDAFLDGMQNAIYLPYDFIHSLGIYINNRFKTKTHILTSNLELGVWHDFDSRITSVLSDSFINWMETEYCESDKPSPENLIKHHLWEISLKYDESMGLDITDDIFGTPTSQAESAKILFEIYQYWKYQRPSMPDGFYGVWCLDTHYLNKIINNRDSMWT